MKKLVLALVLSTSMIATGIAQENEESIIWAVHHITPKAGPQSEITKRIIDHDAKFHEGKSVLLNVMSGNDAGDMLWAYGPMTYNEMDNWKLPDGHEADNMELTNKHIEKYNSMTLWKYQPDLSVDFEDVDMYPKRTHSTYKLKRGTWSTWKELAGKHIEVYKKHNLSEVHVFTAVYGTRDGHNLLLIGPFDKFVSFDADWGYKEKFEAVHGEGSLKETTDKLNAIVEESYSYMTVAVAKE